MQQNFIYHHIGLAVPALEDGIRAYSQLFGYTLTAGPFDDPIQNVSVCFMSRGAGDPAIELVAPLGPDAPVKKILKKGNNLYHVCYEVNDIDIAIDHLREQGSLLLSGPDPAVAFEMRPIAWLMTDVGLLVELLEARKPQNPRI